MTENQLDDRDRDRSRTKMYQTHAKLGQQTKNADSACSWVADCKDGVVTCCKGGAAGTRCPFVDSGVMFALCVQAAPNACIASQRLEMSTAHLIAKLPSWINLQVGHEQMHVRQRNIDCPLAHSLFARFCQQISGHAQKTCEHVHFTRGSDVCFANQKDLASKNA